MKEVPDVPAIRDESRDRRALESFSEVMWEKLRENSHKSHWSGFPNSFLLKRLKDEVEELEEAIRNGDVREVRREAADVANFAMMISDNARDAD